MVLTEMITDDRVVGLIGSCVVKSALSLRHCARTVPAAALCLSQVGF